MHACVWKLLLAVFITTYLKFYCREVVESREQTRFDVCFSEVSVLAASWDEWEVFLQLVAILVLLGNRRRREGGKKPGIFLTASSGSVFCVSDATLQTGEETRGSLPLESVMNSLEVINNFIPPTGRGRRSYLHRASAVSHLGHNNRQTSQHQPRCWSGQTYSCHWNIIHSSLHSVFICLVKKDHLFLEVQEIQSLLYSSFQKEQSEKNLVHEKVKSSQFY